jgi:hypothetical protein
MPDLRNFQTDLLTTAKLAVNPSSVTTNGGNTTIVAPNANVYDIPIIRIRAKVHDSNTGEELQDFTGANAIRFALRVDGFSLAQHRALADDVAAKILRILRGEE